MLKHWENTTDSLSEFEDKFNEFINNSQLNYKQTKSIIKLKAFWTDVIKHINKFNTFVSPVQSIVVKFPSMDKDFLDIWEYYKDYQKEQWGVYIRSRYEIMALESLWKMADEKPDKAVEILKFSMSKGYARFFLPYANSNQNKSESNPTDASDFDYINKKIKENE